MKTYSYEITEGVTIGGYESNEEHSLYENMTKREMFLVLKSLGQLLSTDKPNVWVKYIENEKEILKQNGIK